MCCTEKWQFTVNKQLTLTEVSGWWRSFNGSAHHRPPISQHLNVFLVHKTSVISLHSSDDTASEVNSTYTQTVADTISQQDRTMVFLQDRVNSCYWRRITGEMNKKPSASLMVIMKCLPCDKTIDKNDFKSPEMITQILNWPKMFCACSYSHICSLVKELCLFSVCWLQKCLRSPSPKLNFGRPIRSIL